MLLIGMPTVCSQNIDLPNIPAHAGCGDYLLFKHQSRFWVAIRNNQYFLVKYQYKTLHEAFPHVINHATIRGCSLWLSLDNGISWEEWKPKELKNLDIIDWPD